MTPEDVQAWLDAYIAAWRGYDPGEISNLFADNATYAYNPWGEPIRGPAAIVTEWLSDQDEPGSREAEYRPLLVAGYKAIAIGETRYASGNALVNLWPLTFDEQGTEADGIVSAFGAIWILNDGGDLWVVDPASGDVLTALTVGGQSHGLIAADGAIWAMHWTPDEGRIARVVPVSLEVTSYPAAGGF